MRPLTDDETKAVFSKLAHYIGSNVVHLVDSSASDDGPSSSSAEAHVFRLHRDRVYYVSSSAMKLAISISRPNLCSLGTCFGKFSKTGKFRLHITALDYLVQYAKHKVWVKPNGELPYLYGQHVVKAHLGRITDDTPEHAGVVVMSMSGLALVSRREVEENALRLQNLLWLITSHLDYISSSISQGFGVTARSTADTRRLDPTSIIVYNQADCGSWLRDEDTLF